jgi:hypothetical protein
MTFKVTEINHRCWPNEALVGQALGTFGLSIEQVQQSLRDFVHAQAVDPNRGFQQNLAEALKQHLREFLGRAANLRIADSRYSPKLNEEADLALGPNNTGPRLFIEIEFRPNVKEIITADMKPFKSYIESAKKTPVAGGREMVEIPDEEFEKVKSMFFPDTTT